MSFDKTRFIEPYAQKWGDEAAEYRWRIRSNAILLGVPAFVLLWCALLLPVGVGVKVALLAVFFVLGASLFVSVLVFGRRMNRAASKTLGMTVGWKLDNSPPSKSPAYEEWCTKNGLTPYAASEHFGRGRQSSGSRPS
jgi:hypothetical protein